MLRWLFCLAGVCFSTAYSFDGPDPLGNEPQACADSVAPLFHHGNFVTDANHYFLASFLSNSASREFRGDPDYSKLPTIDLPPAIDTALSNRLKGGTEVELFQKFRSPEITQLYLERRLQRQQEFVIPETRDELQRLLGYDSGQFASETPSRWVWNAEKTWRRRIVEKSSVKNRKRVVYRARDLNLSIAVTYSPDGLSAQETELAVQRGDDSGNWDFYVYSSEGKLATESSFAQRLGDITLAAPYACMACHYNVDKRVFERFPANAGRNRKFIDALFGRL